MSHADLPQYIYHLSYLGIFLWFAIIEQLTPVPEEISLITLGYISRHSDLNPVVCGIISLAGLLLFDNLLFYLSLTGNKFARKMTSKAQDNLIVGIRKKLNQNSKKTLIVLALLPKLRFLSPLISANAGISWRLFLIINSLATCFYVVFYLLLGFLFHQQLETIFHRVAAWQHALFIVAILALAGFFILIMKKYNHTAT